MEKILIHVKEKGYYYIVINARYDDIKTDRCVIFPYKLIEGKAILYTEKELSDTFPLGYSYLKDCEDILRGIYDSVDISSYIE